MANETLNTEPVAPVEATEAKPAESIGGADDLATMLDAYDRQMGSSKPAASAPAPERTEMRSPSGSTQIVDADGSAASQSDAGDQVQRQLGSLINGGAFDPRNAKIAELEKFASEATSFMRQQQEAQWRAIEKSEAESVFGEAEKLVADFKLARVDARAWLKNELDMNAELASAWASRYESNDAMLRARKNVNRALDKLHKHAEREEQRIAAIPFAEDREIVAQYVRGSGYAPPPERPVKLGSLSDDDLKKATKEKHGYVPHF